MKLANIIRVVAVGVGLVLCFVGPYLAWPFVLTVPIGLGTALLLAVADEVETEMEARRVVREHGDRDV